MIILIAFFWFVLSFLLAAVEIEIEGKYGWAEKTATWYRTKGPLNIFSYSVMGGKPSTGYHILLSLFLILIVHLAFFIGFSWSLVSELSLLASYFVFVVFWDFLWFNLNPHYGFKNFKKNKVWWFSKSKWILGLPHDYYSGIVLSLVLASLAAFISGSSILFINQIYFILYFVAFTLLTILFIAPHYHKWFYYMRKRDDRKSAGIFH